MLKKIFRKSESSPSFSYEITVTKEKKEKPIADQSNAPRWTFSFISATFQGLQKSIYHFATIPAVNRQSMELERCPNHLHHGFGKTSSSDWKTIFQFWVLWGGRHKCCCVFFGRAYTALGANTMSQFLGSRFCWKLHYHASLYSPWPAF